MSATESIWAIAKWRFLQSEARLWIINNKFMEIIFLANTCAWIYFEFFTHSYEFVKYIGLFFAAVSLLEIRSRYSTYVGYFDGYEQGFQDAATKNCDYWGSNHNEQDDDRAIISVLNEISKNEANISEENMKARDQEIKEGFSKLLGFFLTWKRIK